MPSSVPKIRYWSRRKKERKLSTGFNKHVNCVCLCTVLVEWSCTFGVGMNPWRGTVDLQWTAIKHFRETGSHLKWKATRLRTGSLWLSEALKCQPGFNELELELSWAEATTKQKALWTPNIYRMYSSSSDKSLITVCMKLGQQRRVKTVRDNAHDSLTNTLGVGGRPLIAGFYGRAEETKNHTVM